MTSVRDLFDALRKDRVRSLASVLQLATLACAVLFVELFLDTVGRRLKHVSEVEWMTGSVLDHVERARLHLPIYTEPSSDWIPFIYPPLYYHLSAWAAGDGAIRTGCRIVSLVATAVTVACVVVILRRLGASLFWILISVGLFFGAYGFTGTWYDIERCDSTLLALLTAATAIMVSSRRLPAAALAGVLVGSAFFAKQQALAFAAAGAVGLLAYGWKHASTFAAAAAAVVVGGILRYDAATHGWFSFYVLELPSAHGIRSHLIPLFFVRDLATAFTMTITTFVLVFAAGYAVIRRVRRQEASLAPAVLVTIAMLAASFSASAMSRLHNGGWDNVLAPWTTFACIGFGWAATELQRRAARTSSSHLAVGATCALAIAQFGLWRWDPAERGSTSDREEEARLVEARARDLERDGEVLMIGRGHVTRSRHFHRAALADVVRATNRVPADVVRAFESRRYAAVVIDEFQELGMEIMMERRSDFFALVTSNYFVADRWDDRVPPPAVGWWAHPSWVLRPRTAPLRGLTDDALERRQRIEVALADMRMRLRQAGVTTPPGADIEQLAARIEAGESP